MRLNGEEHSERAAGVRLEVGRGNNSPVGRTAAKPPITLSCKGAIVPPLPSSSDGCRSV
jgi:hypothetical protein